MGNKKDDSNLKKCIQFVWKATVSLTVGITLLKDVNCSSYIASLFTYVDKFEAVSEDVTEQSEPESVSDDTKTSTCVRDNTTAGQTTQSGQDSSQQLPEINVSKKPIGDFDVDNKTDIPAGTVSAVTNDEVRQEPQTKDETINDIAKADRVTEGSGSDDCVENINYLEGNETAGNNGESNDNKSADENGENMPSKKSSCKVNIESLSQLALFSDKEINKDSTIDILYVDPETDEETDIGSYELSEIVNGENISSEAAYINYINITPGTFIFVFEDCNFEDIDFYVLDDEESSSDDLENDDSDARDIVIPSSEEYQIKMDSENSFCRISMMPSFTFMPLFEFRSEKEADYAVRVVDDDGNELFSKKLDHMRNDSSQILSASCQLEAEEQYYLEIENVSVDGLMENMCCFKIYKNDMEACVTNPGPLEEQ